MIDLFRFNSDPLSFTSGLFWIFFLAFILIYAHLYQRKWQMLVFVTAFSLFFYYKTSGWFVLLLMSTSLVDWLISKRIHQTQNQVHRRAWLVLSLLLSLGILAYFKYANFVLLNFNELIQGNFQPLDIMVPAGISFYTFQTISYIVDVYKRKVAPASTWLEYCFFLSFFPHLLQGPILRANLFFPQIQSNKNISKEMVYAGLWWVIVGIFKKAVIADYISQYNDLIFMSPTAYSGFENAMAILGYTAQIYADFSGYSDIAIGIGIMTGFDLGVNFRMPYQSLNVTEFWHRWHISLSLWLRDYVYFPLGGNRKGKLRTYLNNLLTMLIGGLWHGAAWKYIFWGGMHGVGLLTHKAMQPYLNKIPNNRYTNGLSWLVTFVFVSLLWVFFRATDFTSACHLIAHAFTDFSFDYLPPFVKARGLWCAMLLLIFALHTLQTTHTEWLSAKFISSSWLAKLLILLLIAQLLIQFQSESIAPFIYDQF